MTATGTAEGLPLGFGISLDADAKEIGPGLWFGGQPARVLRLSAAGAAALERLRSDPVAGPADAYVARRLVDAGLAHPDPPATGESDVTVVIPVHGRPDALERCLTALGRTHPVVVVDDASPEPGRIRAVAEAHGATAVRHEVNRGPGAARNTGLARVRTELVAFVDSDTRGGPDWVRQLAAHLADPDVAAVAPRIEPHGAETAAGRYTRARGSLDLGARRGRVVPYTRVSYVPTAALLARTEVLRGLARDVDVFDPTLRVGEDVDLVWRLVAAGHTVRYEPASAVPHDEPASWAGLLARRFRYGTSAAPLAARHPANIAPLVVHPWYSSAVVALLARRPVLAAAAAAGAGARMHRSLRRADVPTAGLVRATAAAAGQTFLGTARYAVQFGWPLLLAALTRRRTRAAAAALLLTPPLVARRAGDAGLGAVPFTVAALADDAAYGAGVVAGCLRHRTTVPLRPTRAR